MSSAPAAPDGKQEVKKAGSKKVLVMALAAVLVAGAGGGGFFWWKSQQAAQAASPSADAPPEPEHEAEPSGALSFDPFIVNLADPGVSRYLKASLRLVVSGVKDMKELEEDKVMMLRLRSAMLEELSQQTSDHLVTPEGKEALKASIAERCTKILRHAKVSDVLLTDFVVQF